MGGSDDVPSKGVLKMLVCRAVDLMRPDDYRRFASIVLTALGLAMTDGETTSHDETGAEG